MQIIYSNCKLALSLILCLSIVNLAACSHFKTRQDVRKESKNQNGAETVRKGHVSDISNSTKEEPQDGIDEEVPGYTPDGTSISPRPVGGKIPKIGLILGPGGARSIGHIGVLQSLTNRKIPVAALVGIEWGAFPAIIFSNKGFANEVEWQMSKLREDKIVKKSIIGSYSPGRVDSFINFLSGSMKNSRIEDGNIPFACPVFNFEKNQSFMLDRGPIFNALSYCLPYPPVFEPFQNVIAHVSEIKSAINFLRSKGVNYIILVNVLGPASLTNKFYAKPDSSENLIWSQLAYEYYAPVVGVDARINISLQDFMVTDFDKSREMIRSSREQGDRTVKDIAERLGF